MKFELMLLPLGAIATLAATLDARQSWNDVPKCKKGIRGPGTRVYDSMDDCHSDCVMAEGASNDNKYGICAGTCIKVGSPAVQIRCFGDKFGTVVAMPPKN